VVNSVQQSLIGARRVFEILDAPIEVRERPGRAAARGSGGRALRERVSFAYDGIDPVLRDIDLDVKPGQCVAILGATGAGKSVLMSLVPRFFDPTPGRVLIDGRRRARAPSTTCAATSASSSRRASSSRTPSRPTSPSGTRRRRRSRSRRRRGSRRRTTSSWAAAGLRHVLGESGNSLSGGQRQRLAIARAVLLEPAHPAARRSDGRDRQRNRARDLRGAGSRDRRPDDVHCRAPPEHAAPGGLHHRDGGRPDRAARHARGADAPAGAVPAGREPAAGGRPRSAGEPDRGGSPA
jgi:hypothetical protein